MKGSTGVPSGVFSCVVDANPRFHVEALRWYATLTRSAGVRAEDLIVHSVSPSSSSIVLDYLRRRGVQVEPVAVFDARSPHCNKIGGALALAARGIEGLAVLTDTDVVVLDDPRGLPIPQGHVGLRTVGSANPSVEVLERVFAEAGVELPALVPLERIPNQQTVSGNGNGGVYMVPADLLAPLTKAWEQWARWLLERRSLLGGWGLHVDQTAMALALASEKLGVHALGLEWNFPSQNLSRISKDAPRPSIIHYHRAVTPSGLLKKTGVGRVDAQIAVANADISTGWRDVFPDASRWDWRTIPKSRKEPGVQDSGERLEHERALIDTVASMVKAGSVLDIGQRDPESASSEFPDGLVASDLADVGGGLEGDLVICLGNLTHEAEPSRYQELVRRVVHRSRRALLISGYEQPPDLASPTVHFHESLSRTLAMAAPDCEAYPVLEIDGVTTYLVLRPDPDRHPRDFDAQTLRPLVNRHPNPLLLADLRLCARQTVRFFSDHGSRLWEYPTVARIVGTTTAPQERVLDVAAGVNPLVPFLFRQGYEVETLDPSSCIREWPPSNDWNERGFLDYAAAGLARKSWNCAVGKLPLTPKFSAAFCIDFPQRIPPGDLRTWLSDIGARLVPEGALVLTFGLRRGTRQMWNTDPVSTVGPKPGRDTFEDFLEVSREAGFELDDSQVATNWGDASTDRGLVVLRRRPHSARPSRLRALAALVRKP